MNLIQKSPWLQLKGNVSVAAALTGPHRMIVQLRDLHSYSIQITNWPKHGNLRISKQPTHCSKIESIDKGVLLPGGELLSTLHSPDPSTHLYQSQFAQEQELAEMEQSLSVFQSKDHKTIKPVKENFGQVRKFVWLCWIVRSGAPYCPVSLAS